MNVCVCVCVCVCVRAGGRAFECMSEQECITIIVGDGEGA